ncbi:uncharacterized protein LOC114273895 [Camellia sinensis]|uniref:uncharacterized protein LOC114273895 n=1 Tax=Camellia sinensis TaxID=4442 RepID=UPI001036EE27|nr:uncharacterized protein LOC114273895 [Camellia sinensis]
MEEHHPHFVVITETQVGGDQGINICKSLGFPNFHVAEPVGFAGGIWLLWNSLEIHCDVLSVTQQEIHACIQVLSQPSSWLFSSIYASPRFNLRKLLWENLKFFANSHHLPWLLMRDFNEILTSTEKFGGQPIDTRRALLFKDCLDHCGLIDMGFSGPRFTWNNCRQSGCFISERLDISLCNESWAQLFPNNKILHLPKLHSDHCPILLHTHANPPPRAARPFRFETIWLSDPSLSVVVSESWTDSSPFLQGTKMFVDRVSIWNRNTFGNIFFQKRKLANRILGIQKSLDSGPSQFLLRLEGSLISDYNRILRLEKEFWALKSRVDGIKANILTHFKDLFTYSFLQSRRVEFPFRLLASIDSVHHPALVATPSLAKIKRVLWSFKPWKALGPDGLNPIFFHKFWATLTLSVVKVVSDAFESGHIDPEINKTLICLIPKVLNPEVITQFRPIGLCNTIYKLITKILVARLRPLLEDLISPLQASFILGRRGVDNVVIVQEVVHSFKGKKGRIGNMLIILDLDKAYDRLEWSFILNVLRSFNFLPIWVNLIMSYVTSSSLAILFNGEKTEEFTPSRGIRQGDPISPYIFILCLEFLSSRISEAYGNHTWTPIRVSRNGPLLSYLFFADDLILFGEASEANCHSISLLLPEFCSLSGQKISFGKSKVLFSSNVQDDKKHFLTSILGIPVTRNLGKYLGCPIYHSRPSRESFQFLIDKIQGKLAGWKSKMLSFAGRATLIKAVNEAILAHIMQCNYIPKSVTNTIDKHNRDFLWGSSSEIRRIHGVAWDTVTKPKNLGGLGIRQTCLVNAVSMAKLSWCLSREDNSLWAKTLKSKYGGTMRVCSKTSPTWRNMLKGSNILEKGSKMLIKDGRSTRFWIDEWAKCGPLRGCIEGPLAPSDSSLRVCDCWVANDWDFSRLSFVVPSEILDCIRSTSLSWFNTGKDIRVWKHSTDGKFRSNFAYLLTKEFHNSPPITNWSWVWAIRVTPRILHFVWRVLYLKLNTKTQLFHRQIVADNLCPVCKCLPETIDHVFRDCPSASHCWSCISIPSEVIPSFSLELHSWFKLNCQSRVVHCSTVNWAILFPFVCWAIWLHRISFCFHTSPTPFKAPIVVAKALEWQHITDSGGLIRTFCNLSFGWKPPLYGAYKLNTDGAAKCPPGSTTGAGVTHPTGLAARGGVIRDWMGCWVAGFVRNIGVASAMEAECWALRDGLKLAMDLGLSGICVETDAKAVINLVLQEPPSDHHFGNLILDCRYLMRELRIVMADHIYREANKCADILANQRSLAITGFHVFDSAPRFVLKQLYDDARGV